MIDQEFIQRVLSPEFQKVVEEYRKEFPAGPNDWAKKNPEKHQKLVKKYESTIKGKIARLKTVLNRQNRYQKAKEGLSWEERKLIRRFYENCPKGYEVDHIVPIGKGGVHRLSNLQYLTKRENRKKWCKLDWENEK